MYYLDCFSSSGIKRRERTSCSSSSSRSSLGSFFNIRALQDREGELSHESAEHAELAEDIDRESKRSLSRLWLWSPGLNFMSSKPRASLSSDDVVTWQSQTYISLTIYEQNLNQFSILFLPTSILIGESNCAFALPVDAVHDIGGALKRFHGAVSNSVGNFLYDCSLGSSFRYLSIS